MKKRTFCSLFLILSLFISIGPLAGATENAATITLSAESLTIEPNETAVLTATSADADSVSWSVIDSKIASADKTLGASIILTGVGPGQTAVIARLGEASERCTVIVSGITITPGTLELGETEESALRLTPYGAATDVAADAWTWSSDNTAVATVEKTENGASVKAVSVGAANITCTNGTYSQTCAVTVKEKEATNASVTLSPESVVVEVGKTASVSATSTASPNEIKWNMEDTKIAMWSRARATKSP